MTAAQPKPFAKILESALYGQLLVTKRTTQLDGEHDKARPALQVEAHVEHINPDLETVGA